VLIRVLFIAIPCVSSPDPVVASTARAPGIHAAHALVYDEVEGRIVYERDADRQVPIASITKLMTAMVVLDARLDPAETIVIQEDDKSAVKPARSRFAVGSAASRGDVLRLALMASDNRAALSLARTYPGGTGAAVAAMNAKAASLGLSSTRFADPSGLDPGNVSTARDLVMVVRAALKYPAIQEATTTREFALHTSRGIVRFGNTDGLLRRHDWHIQLSKTGYINEAGRCLVLHAQIAGRAMTLVFLGAQGKYSAIADAVRVRQWLEAGARGVRPAS
jgi:D-alanyl-D-alanine endopeptidase (penicillin-binding protein 7)